MLDIYKLIYFIWPVWSLQQDWKISNEGPFISLQLRSTKTVGWPYPGGKVCVTAWHVTSRNQSLSSNDQGRQRRETLGTRLSLRVLFLPLLFNLVSKAFPLAWWRGGIEKALAGHMYILHPEILGVIIVVGLHDFSCYLPVASWVWHL